MVQRFNGYTVQRFNATNATSATKPTHAICLTRFVFPFATNSIFSVSHAAPHRESNMTTASKNLCSVAAALVCLAGNARAAISVGPGGTALLTFDTQPRVADGWSTLSVGTGT